MMWCKHCKRNRDTYTDESTSSVCCENCGRVITQDIFSEEVQFIKGSDGQSQAQGSFKSFKKDLSESLERSLNNGKHAISKISSDLDMNNGSLETQAAHFYKVAAEKGFTRGRKTDQVAAACLYTACRANDKPYLLIDFSEKLSISVYRLGFGVYVPLCELLRFTAHDFYRKPVDPSLFIDLFTERLHGVGNKAVSKTALRIIASMKRDWMQTGRKPSGLCGAALYISSLSHGFKYSKSDVAKVVHICEATLSKRLNEFGNTDSGGLTIEEFNKIATEHEKNVFSGKFIGVGGKSSEGAKLLCMHEGQAVQEFAHGLCRSCYEEFIEISGGLEGGSDPPAFQQAERARETLLSMEKTLESDGAMIMPRKDPNNGNHFTKSHTTVNDLAKAKQNVNNTGDEPLVDSEKENAVEHEITDNDMPDKNEAVNPEDDESVDLSDIDDNEVSGYLNSKEETHFKTIIWEVMNKEYLEEQAIKEAAAAAIAAELADLPDDKRAAHELSAAASAAVAKLRKERQQKRAADAKNATPAQTAAEATRQMLTKKKLSSKINYDVLEKLFDSDDAVPEAKKRKVEPQDDTCTLKWGLNKKEEHKAISNDNADEFDLGDDTNYLDDEEEQESNYVNEDIYDFDADNGIEGY